MLSAMSFGRAKIRDLAAQTAMYLMLGTYIGFLLFYDSFHYYSAPFSSAMPSWLLTLLLLFPGVLACYIYPDIVHVMLSSVLLPLSGAAFCFLLFASPAFSPEIVGDFSEWFFELARFILPDMMLACVVIFTTGFVSLYIFDTE